MSVSLVSVQNGSAGPSNRGETSGSEPGTFPSEASLLDRRSAEDLLVSMLPQIEHISRSLCHRIGLGWQETEDFESWVKLQLVEHDYRAIRRYRGGSKLSTYLTSVIRNLFRDFRRRGLGRWRCSADAFRHSPDAVLLERFLYRDGRSIREAVQTLKTDHASRLTEDEIHALAVALPVRPMRQVDAGIDLAVLPAGCASDQRVVERERTLTLRRLCAALRAALRTMVSDDAALIRWHYLDGFEISRIARWLGVRQRSLYRRRDKILHDMRRMLEDRGLDWTTLRGVVGWDERDLRFWDSRVENAGPGNGMAPRKVRSRRRAVH
jgi:RNA polymerase sigma factor (sigma-70 family)